MTGKLAGLRIVEGSAVIAAPLGGLTLAQLGADVIRFDDIKGGLDSDRWPITADGRSIYWAGLNKGKRSIAVDLRNPRGRELLTALITAPGEGAGIFATNMPARGWLAYEELSKKRADLIALNIVGARDGSAHVDYTVNAITGFPMVTGPVGNDGPVNAVAPPWDLATAYAGALASAAPCASGAAGSGVSGGASGERLYPHSLSAHAIIGLAFVPPRTRNFALQTGHGSGSGFCHSLKSHFTVSSL